jgi:hypothetical protein
VRRAAAVRTGVHFLPEIDECRFHELTFMISESQAMHVEFHNTSPKFSNSRD